MRKIDLNPQKKLHATKNPTSTQVQEHETGVQESDMLNLEAGHDEYSLKARKQDRNFLSEDQRLMMQLPSRLLSDTHSTNFYVPGTTNDYISERILLLELSNKVLGSGLSILSKDRLLKLLRFLLNGGLEKTHPEYLELDTNLSAAKPENYNQAGHHRVGSLDLLTPDKVP